MTKYYVVALLILFAGNAYADKVLQNGVIKDMTCAAIEYGEQGVVEHNFDKEYFGRDFHFSIFVDNNKLLKMTTGLYSGVFSLANPSRFKDNGRAIFSQNYNDGAEVVTIVFDFNSSVVTYTNTNGNFYNRLCTSTFLPET
ncbi:hypothetical protein L9G74_05405 [Shewanella sp. C32]|uniref:VirK protein n=1 Tax=Shewanella electrica TaxID=515560 RepID=A0ABT2FHQ7_9GAMM|nr:hypothetical protein [Shewanella electrica]MCH1923966.1 hypothetical protein [Shewanella electrica]MCS4555869.1 hypothetical protein [Shewanella electrica]